MLVALEAIKVRVKIRAKTKPTASYQKRLLKLLWKRLQTWWSRTMLGHPLHSWRCCHRNRRVLGCGAKVVHVLNISMWSRTSVQENVELGRSFRTEHLTVHSGAVGLRSLLVVWPWFVSKTTWSWTAWFLTSMSQEHLQRRGQSFTAPGVGQLQRFGESWLSSLESRLHT